MAGTNIHRHPVDAHLVDGDPRYWNAKQDTDCEYRPNGPTDPTRHQDCESNDLRIDQSTKHRKGGNLVIVPAPHQK